MVHCDICGAPPGDLGDDFGLEAFFIQVFAVLHTPEKVMLVFQDLLDAVRAASKLVRTETGMMFVHIFALVSALWKASVEPRIANHSADVHV